MRHKLMQVIITGNYNYEFISIKSEKIVDGVQIHKKNLLMRAQSVNIYLISETLFFSTKNVYLSILKIHLLSLV